MDSLCLKNITNQKRRDVMFVFGRCAAHWFNDWMTVICTCQDHDDAACNVWDCHFLFNFINLKGWLLLMPAGVTNTRSVHLTYWEEIYDCPKNIKDKAYVSSVFLLKKVSLSLSHLVSEILGPKVGLIFHQNVLCNRFKAFCINFPLIFDPSSERLI